MGIADIKSAFAKAAPGIDLRAVRMRYEDAGAETVLEFDICRSDGSKQTVEERIPSVPGMKPLLDLAMKVAHSLGASVIAQDSAPVTQDSAPITQVGSIAQENKPQPVSEIEKTSHSLLSEVVGGGAPVLQSSDTVDCENAYPKTVEHDGETYELAVDGKPKALFF
jgi:hypothetical protein